MSSYALVFKKKELFTYGANPVIYGLSKKGAYIPSGSDGGRRLMDEELLPKHEQYRYVTYRPDLPRSIDWTHEREWRWRYPGSLTAFEKDLEEFGTVSEADSMPGMDLCSVHCRGMGVVVRSKLEASQVASDILTLVDQGHVSSWHYSFILCANELSPAALRNPDDVLKAIDESVVDLEPFFSMSLGDAKKIERRFHEIASQVEAKAEPPELGECGGVWLWILDNTSKLARALLKTERVFVSNEGRYLARLYEFGDSRCLRQREGMAIDMAKMIEEGFGVECGYFSVLNSDDFNALPYYCDDHLDNRLFYNFA